MDKTERRSKLDWTILRLSMLNNGPRSRMVKVGYMSRGEVGTKIAYSDRVDFILKQVKDLRYLRQALLISN